MVERLDPTELDWRELKPAMRELEAPAGSVPEPITLTAFGKPPCVTSLLRMARSSGGDRNGGSCMA